MGSCSRPGNPNTLILMSPKYDSSTRRQIVRPKPVSTDDFVAHYVKKWAADAAQVKQCELRAVQASAQTALRLHEHQGKAASPGGCQSRSRCCPSLTFLPLLSWFLAGLFRVPPLCPLAFRPRFSPPSCVPCTAVHSLDGLP